MAYQTFNSDLIDYKITAKKMMIWPNAFVTQCLRTSLSCKLSIRNVQLYKKSIFTYVCYPLPWKSSLLLFCFYYTENFWNRHLIAYFQQILNPTGFHERMTCYIKPYPMGQFLILIVFMTKGILIFYFVQVIKCLFPIFFGQVLKSHLSVINTVRQNA